MFISIEGHLVTDFDTQSAFNRWWTTTSKASWIKSILYDYRLDGPAIREPNLMIRHSCHDGIIWLYVYVKDVSLLIKDVIR